MNFRYFYLAVMGLLISCAPQTHQKIEDLAVLNYNLTPIISDVSENSLIVELNFIGDSDGETEIVLGQAWADEQAPWERFKDIKFKSEEQSLPFNQDTKRLTVSHEANIPLKLTYRLNQNDGREAQGDSACLLYTSPSPRD